MDQIRNSELAKQGNELEMTVYVDDYRAPFGRLKLSHMIADTDAELEEMARRLDLKKEWKHGDHYDICWSKRSEAIRLGAKPVTCKELARIRRTWKTVTDIPAMLRKARSISSCDYEGD